MLTNLTTPKSFAVGDASDVLSVVHFGTGGTVVFVDVSYHPGRHPGMSIAISASVDNPADAVGH